MIPFSDTFLMELDKQIRNRGRCKLFFDYVSTSSMTEIEEATIQSVSWETTGDPLSRELPTERLTITLTDYEQKWRPGNSNGEWAKFDEGVIVRVRIGIETDNGPEWGPDIVYRATGRIVWSNFIATIQCERELGAILTKSEFISFLGATDSLGKVALAALQDAYPLGTPIEYLAYDFESDLDNVRVIEDTTLEDYNCADALMAVALAGRCAVRTKYDGTVEIKDFYRRDPQKTKIVVTKNDMFSEIESDVSPKIRNEIVTYHKNVFHQDTEEVLDFSGTEEYAAADKMFLRFTSPILPATFVMSEQTNVGSIGYYVYRNGIRITSLSPSESGAEYTIKGTARPQRNAAVQTKRGIFLNPGNEDEEVDNPLVNKYNFADVAEYRGLYLGFTRELYSVRYRGNPAIEPFDLIRVELPFHGMSTCIVLKAAFEYQYGFSGELTVRRLSYIYSNQEIKTAVSDYAVSDEAISDEE